MRGYATTFVGMFHRPLSERTDADTGTSGSPSTRIEAVEVPLIQRDYAQGRQQGMTPEIREDFLRVLLGALAGGPRVSLDFVYGRVTKSTLLPLDGQQRLTTLFLLHWYVASAAGTLTPDAPWTRFSYATRPGARLFCQRLARTPLPAGTRSPSQWIVDQPWYQFGWRHDPTIQSALVMIDAIDDGLRQWHPGLDLTTAWRRLTDLDEPAISFYVLPLDDLDSDEDLYIKMNSRGRPLTPFENFKALLEQEIAYSGRAADFAQQIDGAWSDMFWRFDDGDDVIDDELMRYLDFVTTVCEYRQQDLPSGRLRLRMHHVFGEGNDRAANNLDFLFRAFDAWLAVPQIDGFFDERFSTATVRDEGYVSGRVTVFAGDAVASANLFGQCLRFFDGTAPRNRNFSLQHLLLLYATVQHLIGETEEFIPRARVLRNLIAASGDEVRREVMPQLLADVDLLIGSGNVAQLSTTFARSQIDDETAKATLLGDHPGLTDPLRRLEDHPLLRGTLSAFDLDPDRFAARAAAFEDLFAGATPWPEVTGALLATGPYQRKRGRSPSWQFGTPAETPDDRGWRPLLTGGSRDDLASTREVLMRFLDAYEQSGLAPRDFCAQAVTSFCAAREQDQHLDWRYYWVRYAVMRSGTSGIYYGYGDEPGYDLIMLIHKQLNSHYRDPYLLQVYDSLGQPDRLTDPWFTGYLETERWMRLVNSAAGIRCVPEGFELGLPAGVQHAARFRALCDARGGVEPIMDDGAADEGETHPAVPASGDAGSAITRFLLRVPQRQTDHGHVDTADRITIASAFLREALDAGF